MFAGYAPQILSLKDEYTLHFSNFLIVGSCNYSANSWFAIISLLKPLPEADLYVREADLLSKNLYKQLKLNLFDIHYNLHF